MKTPALNLSLGQIAWSLNFGQEPRSYFFDRLNYLRRLDIPFPKEKRPSGSGNHIGYGYGDLIECGVALFALHNGMTAADISRALIDDRINMRALYQKALEDQPEEALTAYWVKSRGKSGAIPEGEIFLRLHDKYSDSPGRIELLGFNVADMPEGAKPFDPVEFYDGEPTRRLVPLTRLVLQWTAWALEAPLLRTGPKS